MDIEEAKNRVEQMERDITRMLQKLEMETGLSVTGICVAGYVSELGRRGTSVGAVQITANILGSQY